MNGLEVTPDRQDRVRFSRPYYVYKLQMVVRSGEDEVRSLADCRTAGTAVGTLEGTAAARLLDRLGIDKKVYDSQVTPYQDLEVGRLRGCPHGPAHRPLLRPRPSRAQVR